MLVQVVQFGMDSCQFHHHRLVILSLERVVLLVYWQIQLFLCIGRGPLE